MASYAPAPAHDGKVEGPISCKYPLLWGIGRDLIKLRSENKCTQSSIQDVCNARLFPYM